MAQLTDIALLGPRLAIGATRMAVSLVPKAASTAGHLLGGVLGQVDRPESTFPPPPERPAERAPTSSREPAREDEERQESSEAENGEQPSEVEVPEVRSTVPQAVGGGFPEPPGKDPGDISGDPNPHHSLSTPVGEPDPTEWPDPYDQREDPRDPPDPDGQPFGEEPHPHVGSTSTSDPHPAADIEAPDATPPRRDRIDD